MEKAREEMVREIKVKYGFDNQKVLDVLLQVPRHEFVDPRYRKIAYKDTPVDIGFSQTISQPFTVALMTHLVTNAQGPKTKDQILSKVLEIGTGSGYQAAVLSKFFSEVYTVEIIPELAIRARTVLVRLGYKNVFVKEGSGEWGWKEHSPFDAVLVTAGMKKVPQELFDQLKVSGVLVAPVGKGKEKEMIRYTKLKEQGNQEIKEEKFGVFTFVPFLES